MRRPVILGILLVLAGVAAWVWFIGLNHVTAGRIESTLIARGVPQPMAECMAGRMVDRLTMSQLRKLEELGAREGENPLPLSTGELLARIRRVNDPEALEVTATAAAVCAMKRSAAFR